MGEARRSPCDGEHNAYSARAQGVRCAGGDATWADYHAAGFTSEPDWCDESVNGVSAK